MSLKQMIKNELSKDRGLQERIAKLAGYQSPSGFSKFLNKPDSEMADFKRLLAVINELFPGQEKSLIKDYVYQLKAGYTARMCLEYTNANKMYEEFEYLVEILSKNKKNPLDQEWAKVYEYDYKVIKGLTSANESLILLDGLKSSCPEMYAYSQIIRFYYLYDLGFYESMSKLTGYVRGLVDSLEEGYLKDSYTYRTALIASEVDLHKNNLTPIREFAPKIKDCRQASLQCMLYLQAGNSYIFEDYEQSNKYLNLSNKVAMLNKRESEIYQSQKSLNFLNTYWRKGEVKLNPDSKLVSDIHEIAFYYIQYGETEKGLDILNSIDIDSLTDSQKGFHFYYRGLATNNESYFYQSLGHFSEAGEVYYKKISLIELQKAGTNDYVLKALAV